MLRRLAVLLAIATAQAMLTIALTVSLFSSSMARFDTGAAPEASAGLVAALLHVLSFPLLPLLSLLPKPMRFSGFPVEHLLFLANGLIWAIVLLWLYRRYRRWRSHGA
jgi:hypothetical protein